MLLSVSLILGMSTISGNDDGDQFSRRVPARVTKGRRAYKACFFCRARKSRCELGSNAGPPCIRCRREQRKCSFPEQRSSTALTKGSTSLYKADLRKPETRSRSHITRDQTNSMSPQRSDENNEISNTATPIASRIDSDLMQSVIETVVSNGNDALKVLFQAALQQQHLEENDPKAAASTTQDLIVNERSDASSSTISQDCLEIWNKCRLVRAGWVTAEEAMFYVDSFFKNIGTLTPLFQRQTCEHPNHWHLIATEPFLCCVILMISARYNQPSTAGAVSRSGRLHDRLWTVCQQFINRAILAQDFGPSGSIRTLGSVEAFILLSEWHPRAIHFPPEADGFDLELLITDDRDKTADRVIFPTQSMWSRDVKATAKRSDRMSWMLLGCALSMAHELGVFTNSEDQTAKQDDRVDQQRSRIRRLLYIYINQLALRQGSTTLLPQNHETSHSFLTSLYDLQEPYLKAWADLTDILVSFHEKVFGHKDQVEGILHSHRYRRVVSHFGPLLVSWRQQHIDKRVAATGLDKLLTIEYHYSQLYINSVGIQAACEREYANKHDIVSEGMSLDDSEKSYVEAVICHACELLGIITDLGNAGVFRYAPVRTFLRVTTTSVVLLKALACGVRTSQFRQAVDALTCVIRVIRNSVVDDVHIANGYASLLDLHLEHLRNRLDSVQNPCSKKVQDERRSHAASVMTHECASAQPDVSAEDETVSEFRGNSMEPSALPPGDASDEWLTMPFDPTMAPLFPPGFRNTAPSMFVDNGLEFLWNA